MSSLFAFVALLSASASPSTEGGGEPVLAPTLVYVGATAAADVALTPDDQASLERAVRARVELPDLRIVERPAQGSACDPGVIDDGATLYGIEVTRFTVELVSCDTGANRRLAGCPPYVAAGFLAQIGAKASFFRCDTAGPVLVASYEEDPITAFDVAEPLEPEPARAQHRRETRDRAIAELAARLGRKSLQVRSLNPGFVARAVEGGSFELVVPEFRRPGLHDQLRLLPASDADAGGYAVISSMETRGDGAVLVRGSHLLGGEPLPGQVVVRQPRIGFDVGAGLVTEVVASGFPYPDGARTMAGLGVFARTEVGHLISVRQLSVTADVDVLRPQWLLDRRLTLVHGLVGVRKELQTGRVALSLAVRGGVSWYVFSPAAAEQFVGVGGDVVFGVDVHVSRSSTVFGTVAARAFTNPLGDRGTTRSNEERALLAGAGMRFGI